MKTEDAKRFFREGRNRLSSHESNTAIESLPSDISEFRLHDKEKNNLGVK